MRVPALLLLLTVLVRLAPARAADAPPAPAAPAAPAPEAPAKEAPAAEDYEAEIAEVQAVGGGEAYRVRLAAKGLPEALRAKASFTMFIGENEGRTIVRAQQKLKPLRPLTHDLLAASIRRLGGRIERITITKLAEGTFYAEILVAAGGKKLTLDARPSDAMALALLAGAPVYVRAGVLRESGEDPELPETPAAPEPRFL